MSQDKVAVITAGGSGMGAGAARKLAAEGYKVAVLSSSGKGEDLANELSGFGYTGSNLNPDDLSEFISKVLEKWGRIDVVVNSAGHGPKGDILEMTDEDYIKGMEVYLLNVIRIARLVTPVMLKQGCGSIVNISTYACFEPEELFPTSGMFRSSLAAFSKLYADKYADKGIRINNILPGFIDSLPEKDERRARIPMGRYGKVEEIADAIYFLASEKSSYITGQNLRVDGGITRSV
ncbi:SDR family oxidoreductase [Maridesulfovibrio zosterae]|uniref:SDR family oxidoreductase n=1 Tax=Maridesulfovibrio zosterae TaxID=82171 RepID=UPI00041231BC|nr:SDR family oxidoreductase [Maridesulfovibrio zosterae]